MSEKSLADFGLKNNPFDLIIADEENSTKYKLYGRTDQLKKIDAFIEQALSSKIQKRILLRGEYGTGKSHHLLQIHKKINDGEYGEKIIAVYLGNLGLSFRRFYEIFIETLKAQNPEYSDFLSKLKPVEPEESADPSYNRDKLRDNILENFKQVITKFQYDQYQGIFLLIDEAEDIVQSNDNDEIQYFIQSLRQFIDHFQGQPLHIVMGLSREALAKISSTNDGTSQDRKLGDALFQRFSGKEEIVLGYLSFEDTKEMVLDRLNHARIEKNSGFYPIKEGVIKVINEITGGHPREMLTLINKGVENAMKSGSNEVDGNCILPVFARHESFFNKKIILDWNRLAEITSLISEKNDLTGADFERLRGKLIGESESISISDFTDRSHAEKLTQPYDGIRILLRKDSGYGETEYIIHPDFKADVFKGKRYTSDTEQQLDREIIDLLQNPEQYQKQLTSGFWRLIQESSMKAELKESEVTEEYQIIIGKPVIGTSSSLVSVAFAAYKGREFPKTLYNHLLRLLDTKLAHFCCVLYDAPRLEIDPVFKSFMNDVRDKGQKKLYENICTILVADLPVESNQLMGKIKLLSNRENKLDDPSDIEQLFQDIKIEATLSKLVDEKAITYPEDENIRRIVNTLAAKSLDKFTLGDLKKDCPFIAKAVMDRLESQRYVVKDGNGWKIAPINTDPPWKAIYSLMDEKKQVLLEEIREYLNDKFVLQCPSGDENQMVTWYLEILLNQNMISVDTKDGKLVYQLMDHSGRLDALLQSFNEQLTVFEETIKAAIPLQISTSDFVLEKDGYLTRRDRLQEKITIGSQEVTECMDLLENIKKSNVRLKKEISDKKKEYSALVKSKDNLIELFDTDIKTSFADQYITDDERRTWSEKVEEIRKSLQSNLEQENYATVVILTEDLDRSIKQCREQMSQRKTSKEPCVTFAGKYDSVSEKIKTTLAELERLGYTTKDIRIQMGELSNRYEQEYKPLFNSGKYNEAITSINDIFTKADDIQTMLNQLLNQYSGYTTKIERLKEYVKGDPGLQSLFDDLKDSLSTWDFATIEIKINTFETQAKESAHPIKTKEEIFIEKFGKAGKVSLDDVLKKYPIDEAFDIIKHLVSDHKIKHIELRFK